MMYVVVADSSLLAVLFVIARTRKVRIRRVLQELLSRIIHLCRRRNAAESAAPSGSAEPVATGPVDRDLTYTDEERIASAAPRWRELRVPGGPGEPQGVLSAGLAPTSEKPSAEAPARAACCCCRRPVAGSRSSRSAWAARPPAPC
jgi:hypothetical protein